AGLLQGTVELLVLKTLSWGPMHGYGVAGWIERVTDDVLRVEEGSLYPALYRMTRKGWIRGTWGGSENNRRAKYYELTAAGRRQLAVQVSGWHRLARAVTQAVSGTEAPVRAGGVGSRAVAAGLASSGRMRTPRSKKSCSSISRRALASTWRAGWMPNLRVPL